MLAWDAGTISGFSPHPVRSPPGPARRGTVAFRIRWYRRRPSSSRSRSPPRCVTWSTGLPRSSPPARAPCCELDDPARREASRLLRKKSERVDPSDVRADQPCRVRSYCPFSRRDACLIVSMTHEAPSQQLMSKVAVNQQSLSLSGTAPFYGPRVFTAGRWRACLERSDNRCGCSSL
jgi:hypothetical protein